MKHTLISFYKERNLFSVVAENSKKTVYLDRRKVKLLYISKNNKWN